MRINPEAVPTTTFDWGSIKWFVTPDAVPGAGSTFGEVIVNPGMGHARHNHPDAEELLYVIAGEARQMPGDDEELPIRADDAVHIPTGAYHSTYNTRRQQLRPIGTYTPHETRWATCRARSN